MFYNKEIEVLVESVGQVNDMGIYVSGTPMPNYRIRCDVQNYSTQLLQKDYGYTDDVSLRVFCDVDSRLKTGQKILYLGQEFKIVRIFKENSYMELMLNG